jgi:hypothetical protein
MFRHRPLASSPPPPARSVADDSLEARLRALGHLLDQRGYIPQGLCVLEVDDGYEVNALQMPAGAAYGLAQQSETIPAAELAATIALLRAMS